MIRKLKAADASSELSCPSQHLCKSVSPMSDPDILIENAEGEVPPESADFNYCILHGQSIRLSFV
jgi:hypothetical protein